MNRPIGNKKGGFTLMEVITAVFVFLVGVVGVISLFAAAAVFHKDARNKTLISMAVEQVIMEIDTQLKENRLRDEKGGFKAIKDGRIPGFDRFGYEAEFVSIGLTEDSMVKAEVRLTWKEKGKTKGESFDYLFRPGVSFKESIAAFRQEKAQKANRVKKLLEEEK